MYIVCVYIFGFISSSTMEGMHTDTHTHKSASVYTFPRLLQQTVHSGVGMAWIVLMTIFFHSRFVAFVVAATAVALAHS